MKKNGWLILAAALIVAAAAIVRLNKRPQWLPRAASAVFCDVRFAEPGHCAAERRAVCGAVFVRERAGSAKTAGRLEDIYSEKH